MIIYQYMYLLHTLPVNINGYVPFLINMFDCEGG